MQAALQSSLPAVPVLVHETGLSESKILSLQITENLQREELNALDKADSYKRLMDLNRWTQQQVGDAVGKPREVISKSLKLLTLTPEIQKAYQEAASEGNVVTATALYQIALKPEGEQQSAWEAVSKGESSGKALRRSRSAQSKRVASPAAQSCPQEEPPSPQYVQNSLVVPGGKVIVEIEASLSSYLRQRKALYAAINALDKANMLPDDDVSEGNPSML